MGSNDLQTTHLGSIPKVLHTDPSREKVPSQLLPRSIISRKSKRVHFYENVIAKCLSISTY